LSLLTFPSLALTVTNNSSKGSAEGRGSTWIKLPTILADRRRVDRTAHLSGKLGTRRNWRQSLLPDKQNCSDSGDGYTAILFSKS